jgi:hypothetical protein
MGIDPVILWIAFALLGRLLMFLWLKQPLSKWLGRKNWIFRELFDCSLCLGVWTYWIMSFLFRINNIEIIKFAGIPVVDDLFTGALTSFIFWVFETGWKVLFTSTVIAPDED